MKIAFCFFGHTGSWSGKDVLENKITPKIAIDNYKNFLFKNHETDIFIHSWSKEYKSEIDEALKPKKSFYEIQKDFSNITISEYSNYSNGQNLTNDAIKLDGLENIKENEDLIYRSQSRWYSNSESLKLMLNYSKLNNIKYDWVVQLRFDLFFFKAVNFEKLDPLYFYSPNRNHEKNIAINDHYFISNLENAKKFAKIKENSFKLSIRPTCAAKQFLDLQGINQKDHFDVEIDFHLIRWIHKDINKFKFKLKRFIKKILRFINVKR